MRCNCNRLWLLDKWFDYSESSVASVIIQIAFSEIPTFQNMMNASTLLGLDTKLNRDSLYDELVETKLGVWVHYIAEHSQRVCHSKMAAILHSVQKQCDDECRPLNFELFRQRCLFQEATLSAKEFFSLMNAKWRADRNRASLSLIKNELQIYLNYEKSCRDTPILTNDSSFSAKS